MLKRTCLVLSIGLLAAAALWLVRGNDGAVNPREVSKEVRSPEFAGSAAEAIPETSVTEGGIPESERHAAGEIERHRASRVQLVALEKAVREQDEKLRERRKVLAAIVRSKGVIYQGADMKIEPPAQGPATHSETAETPDDPGHQAEMARKDAEARGRDARAYVEAKQQFETDQEQLQQMQLKLATERARLKAEGR